MQPYPIPVGVLILKEPFFTHSYSGYKGISSNIYVT